MTTEAVEAGATQRQPGYAWVVMALLWGMDLVNTLVFFSIGVLIPVLRGDLGVTTLQAGLLGSAGFFGFGLMALPSSIWLTRHNPRLTTLLLALGMAGAALMQALAPSGPVLLLGRFLFVALGVSRVQVQVLFLVQWIQPRLYAPVNSLEFGTRAAGQLLATGVTPLLIVALNGWRGFFLLCAAGMLAMAALWLVLGRERGQARPARAGTRPANPGRVLLRHKLLWVLSLSQVGAAVAFSAFITFYPSYFMERAGVSLTTAGVVMSFFSVGGLVGSLTFGPLSQWAGRRKPFVWVPGLLLPALYAGLVWADSVPLAALLMVGAGLCAMGVAPVIFTIPLDMGLEPREVAVGQALLRTLFPVGATLGPLLVGVLAAATGSLATALYIVAPTALSLFVIGIFLPETGRRRG